MMLVPVSVWTAAVVSKQAYKVDGCAKVCPLSNAFRRLLIS